MKNKIEIINEISNVRIMASNAKQAGVRLRGPAPSLAESTKIALLANTHNSIYKALRWEDKIQKHEWLKEERIFQNG